MTIRDYKAIKDHKEQAKNGRNRCDIRPGQEVDVVLKKDQRSNKKTRGIVEEILTNSPYHPHGIKVRLKGGQIGRVQEIIRPLQ